MSETGRTRQACLKFYIAHNVHIVTINTSKNSLNKIQFITSIKLLQGMPRPKHVEVNTCYE
jgi:hypothetical protein